MGISRARRALHVTSQNGCLECVAALVEAGADVNAFMASGETPLHLAKREKHTEVADYLSAHGVIQPKPSPISGLLAAADVEEGRKAFGGDCARCHFVDPLKGRKIGPNLWDVVGRAKASMPEGGYSDALKAWGGTWTYEDLNAYLWKPMVTAPGVFMEISGIENDNERTNLIAYLRTLSDSPVALP